MVVQEFSQPVEVQAAHEPEPPDLTSVPVFVPELEALVDVLLAPEAEVAADPLLELNDVAQMKLVTGKTAHAFVHVVDPAGDGKSTRIVIKVNTHPVRVCAKTGNLKFMRS